MELDTRSILTDTLALISDNQSQIKLGSPDYKPTRVNLAGDATMLKD